MLKAPSRTRVERVVHLRVDAPVLPSPGAPCNGCGVCCAAEPCPLGMLVSRRHRGRCRALHWDAAQGQYRCGMLTQPQHLLPWWPQTLAPWLARWLRRWISSGSGCDANLQASPPPH